MSEEFETMSIRPTIPLVIMYQIALYWKKQASIARAYEGAAKREMRLFKEEKKKFLPKVVKSNPNRITKKLHRNDLIDLLLMAHISIEALIRLKQNPRDSAFLNGTILCFAKTRTTITVRDMTKRLGAYRNISNMNLEVGVIMSNLRKNGYLDSTDANGDRVYYITEKGRKFARTIEDSINLVLTHSWRKPEDEAKA